MFSVLLRNSVFSAYSEVTFPNHVNPVGFPVEGCKVQLVDNKQVMYILHWLLLAACRSPTQWRWNYSAAAYTLCSAHSYIIL